MTAATRAQLDVTDLGQVRRWMHQENPELVVHTAAFTDVDACEREPDTGFLVNTVGTWNVALAGADVGAILVYISTCGVFDGQKGAPYNEFDHPHPVTKYHLSKYVAEKLVPSLSTRYFIIRPGWMFGGSARHRRNFVERRRQEALGKPRIESAKDKFGSPTYTVDLARKLLELIEAGTFGLYHLANSGFASRYEYVRKIIGYLGMPTEVMAVGSDAFPRSAPVPAWEALDNYCLRLRGFQNMRPWEEALQDYIANRLLPELDAQGAG